MVPVSAYSSIFGDLPLEQYDDIDTAVITLIFEKGCIFQIENSFYSSYGYDQRIEVFGEKGMVTIQNILEEAVQITGASGHHKARAQYFLSNFMPITIATS